MNVRAARRDDHAAFVRLWADLGTEQRPPELDRWDEHFRPHTLFAEDDTGVLAGYALALPFGARGDVRQLVVDPAWRGRGVGRALMSAVAARLREAGCTNWRLEVRADNAAAIALYRAIGMHVLHEIEVLRSSYAAVERFATTRSGRFRVEVVEPADDAALEARFDLGEGQLARWRAARPEAPMWRIGHDALLHYMRDFVPAFSLLFPFRAVDADHAAHLVACAIERGMRDECELLVVDRPVSEVLCASGARVKERLFEMGGPL